MQYSSGKTEESRAPDRVNDDMASRRISSHVPAPLRKKKNDDNYKRFITPTGNPMAALQQHMRSKSMSDLNAEKEEEQKHRAEINTRYKEMEKLKAMLKEDEDSWKSKLQNWKNRRRSVTEDARKRKEERDKLEREAEIKLHRKTKTYREIVEEKKRREQELANLNDDEFSPRSSEPDKPIRIIQNESPQHNSSILSSDDEAFPPPPPQIIHQSKSASYSPQKSQSFDKQNDSKVEYKYTTKVTAQIGEATTPVKAPQQVQPNKATIGAPSPASSKPQDKRNSYESSKPSNQVPQNSNVPKVLLRSKGQNTMKERPKSAHELMQGSSTLPRSYQYNPTPKPFVAGESDFMRYRKTAFANRRNMWESMGSHTTEPVDCQQSSDDLILSGPMEPPKQATAVAKPQQSIHAPRNGIPMSKNTVREPEAVIPRAAVTQKPLQAKTQQKSVVYPTANTAKLSSTGLCLASPRLSKQNAPSQPTGALFDDMKICINQRPRSEKGFGFTVRGGDDGKPVIVDTVSPGGAADICHLCVSDEILAINEVLLADCKTQNDIVHLIVSSVITGHLSLNIRRYGKPKKTSSLGLSGTKVVMTPGGFVQVRSDKSGSVSSSPRSYRKSNSYKDNNNNGSVNGLDDLPPPPTREELDHAMTNPSQNVPNMGRGKSIDMDSRGAFAEVYPNPNLDRNDDTDGLQKEVLDAQNALNFEHAHIKQNLLEKSELRRKLLEEQERLDREEAQRELERQKLQEEAKLEDQRVEEELRRIQARTQRQMEERRSQQQQRVQNPFPRPYSASSGPSKGGMHWLVEEAERQRKAESSGRIRMNALSQSKKMDAGAGSIIPPHVIQRLTQRSTKVMGQSS